MTDDKPKREKWSDVKQANRLPEVPLADGSSCVKCGDELVKVTCTRCDGNYGDYEGDCRDCKRCDNGIELVCPRCDFMSIGYLVHALESDTQFWTDVELEDCYIRVQRLALLNALKQIDFDCPHPDERPVQASFFDSVLDEVEKVDRK